jgi:hypothetical protein
MNIRLVSSTLFVKRKEIYFFIKKKKIMESQFPSTTGYVIFDSSGGTDSTVKVQTKSNFKRKLK